MRKGPIIAIIGVAILILIVWSVMSRSDETTEEGECIVTCTNDTACGPSGPYGQTYCKDGDVWQYHYVNACKESGSCQSWCFSEQTQKLVQRCENGCESGRCT